MKPVKVQRLKAPQLRNGGKRLTVGRDEVMKCILNLVHSSNFSSAIYTLCKQKGIYYINNYLDLRIPVSSYV